MPIAYQFLPWVRRGLAVALDGEDNLGIGAPLAARGTAQIGVTLAAPHEATAIAPLAMRLHGPGDVIGIDQRLVVRTDPKPNARNFEPNYLAIVDFDPPDFPWMLTPAKAQGDRRLRPWLVLVVLDAAKTGLPRVAGAAPLPSIRIKAADVASELPDLADSWSWAHAQLVNDNAAQIQADLQGKPSSNISRLVCPRRLKERTDYVACVVPAFEPGRRRGLALVPTENDPAMTTLAPAWNRNAAADVVLPVYYHWEFSTGPKGDFESLARRLRTPGSYKGTPVEAQLKAVGTIPMSIDNILNGPSPGLTTTMEGALVPISFQPGTPPPGVQAESLEIIVNTPQEQVVNPVGDGPDLAANRRLEVKPPMYGGWHAKQHQVFRAGFGPASAPKLGAHWLADLNLNPRYRGAAGYGTEVVRMKQEEYVDACWDQIGDILAAEMKFNLTRLAIESLGALKRKHYDVLPPERLLQLFGPALPRVEALGTPAQTFRINGTVASLGGRLARSSMPAALVDTAMRRVASPANRSLRMAARLNRTIDALPAAFSQYVTTMARATRKPAAFSVNTFVPDGILSTKLFEGVDLRGAATRPVDLSSIGLRGDAVTVGEVRKLLASSKEAERALAQGVPEPKLREGQNVPVFTDLHVDRFGTLAALSPAVRPDDWLAVASLLDSPADRDAAGFLVEMNATTGVLQISSLRVDRRSGEVTVGRVVGRIDATGRRLRVPATTVTRPRARGPEAAKPAALARIEIGEAREFDEGGLLAALPPNALSTAEGEPLPTFTLDPGFELRPSQERQVPAVASVTLPAPIRGREAFTRLTTATRGVQTTWRDAFVSARVEVLVIDFPLRDAAAVVRARTDPALTLPLRLASTVSIAQAAFDRADPHVAAFLPANAGVAHRFMIPKYFDRVMAWPHLRNAFYRDLAEYDKNAFMPGIDDLPEDLIMLVQVNQYFIDAVMAGANYEMNRELLWRGFPTDLRGTPFQRFWGRIRFQGLTIELLNDMEPMHQWRPQPLGKRTDANMVDPDRIALLVRGQLLRRYPNTAVYAWKKRTTPASSNDPTLLMKDPDGNPSAGAIQTPVFSGFIPPDVTFFGFDIDKGDVAKWCFVLEEQMSEPRFGFDVDVTPPGQPQGAAPKQRTALKAALLELAQPNSVLRASGYNPYKAMSWTHLQVAPGAFATVQSLVNVADPPFTSFPTVSPNATAAEIAKALLQEPFRAYYLGADLAT